MSNIEHPKHYNLHPSGVECIELVRYLDFCLGNAVKYVYRFEHKNGTEDLEKALFYIDYLIKNRVFITDGMSPIEAAEARANQIIASQHSRDHFFSMLSTIMESEENPFRKDFFIELFQVVAGVSTFRALYISLNNWIIAIKPNTFETMMDNTVAEG